ncbi:MAG TPA: tetratricopeptide repeat protein [Chthoniobacterales bacterium]
MAAKPKPNPEPQPSVNLDSDLDAAFFWEEHKTKIVAIIAAAVLAVAGYTAWQFVASQNNAKAAAAFEAAHSTDELEEFVKNFPNSVAAGNAQLLIAGNQRAEGKFDDALKTLTDFTSKRPKHPLIADTWLSYAATLEVKKDFPKALEAYASVASKYGQTSAAPAALSAQARLTRQQNDAKKARDLYENLVQRFPASFWAQEAQQELSRLPKTGEAPLKLETPAASPAASAAPANPAASPAK